MADHARSHLRFLLAIVLSFFAAGLCADGPETGLVAGRVLDPAGNTLGGVLVTLAGERGNSTTITDSAGRYRFGLLAPGQYSLTATLESFEPAKGTVRLIAGGTAKLDLELLLESSEQIEVTAEAPLIDKYNVIVGGTVKAETVAEVAPVSRSLYGAFDLLPGVTHDPESRYLNNTRPTVNGSLWQEQNLYIDGVDATFSMRGGGTRVFMPSISVSEVSLLSGGSGSEYGRNVGSHTNLIIRSGTNAFRGGLAGVLTRERWNSNYDSQPALAEEENLVESFAQRNEDKPEDERVEPVEAASNFLVFDEGERDDGTDNIELSLGGPLRRDRAWFFVSRGEVSGQELDKLLDGSVVDTSGRTKNSLVKLTAQAGASHSLALMVIDSPASKLFLQPQMADRYVTTFFDLGGSLSSLTWNDAISPNVFLETKIARQTSREDRRRPFSPEEKALDPNYLANPALGPLSPNNNDAAYVQQRDQTWHNGWIFERGFGTNRFPRDQANVAVTQFVGEHELRYGIDYQQVAWEQNVERPNQFVGESFELGTPLGYDSCEIAVSPTNSCFFFDYNPPDVVAAGRGRASSDGKNLGLYGRNRFQLGSHWLFNLGLRLERQELGNDRGRKVIESTDLSPRLAVVYDLGGDGRKLLSLSAGRLFNQTAQDLVNSNLQEDWTGASNAFDFWMHITSADPFFSLVDPVTGCAILQSLGFPVDVSRSPYCLSLGSVRPGELWQFADAGRIDVDIEPYHRDEIVLGYEWQFADRWAFDAKAVWWRVDNLIGSTLQRDDEFGLFLLVENYDDYATILRNLNWVDNFTARGLGTREDAEAILDGFSDDNRRYRNLQLQLSRHFHRGWAWYVNLTLARAEGSTYGSSSYNNLNDDYGRNLELVLSDDILATVDCEAENLAANCTDALLPFLGQPVSTINRQGRMPIDREIIFKSYGYKRWDLGRHALTLGGSFVWESGSTYSAIARVSPPISIEDNAIATTPIGLFLTPRGALENGGFWRLNMSGAWDFPLGKKNLTGNVRIEVSNLINRQEQIATNSENGRPLRSRRSFQRPRSIRVLAGVRF